MNSKGEEGTALSLSSDVTKEQEQIFHSMNNQMVQFSHIR